LLFDEIEQNPVSHRPNRTPDTYLTRRTHVRPDEREAARGRFG
jgi:hypothetical protein